MDPDDTLDSSVLATIEKEPTSYKEAMRTKEAAQWKEAYDEEIESMVKNNIWDFVTRPRGKTILDSRCVFKKKLETDGRIHWRTRYSKDSLFIHQTGYCCKILERFGMTDSKPKNTPMVTLQAKRNSDKRQKELSEMEGALVKKAQPIPYCEAISSLSYQANGSRPDIAYVVNQLSRRQNDPTDQDFEYVKRVFRYLKGTEDFGLTYLGKEDCVESYSDASHLDCPDSRCSTTGFTIKVFVDLVHWNSK